MCSSAKVTIGCVLFVLMVSTIVPQEEGHRFDPSQGALGNSKMSIGVSTTVDGWGGFHVDLQ